MRITACTYLRNIERLWRHQTLLVSFQFLGVQRFQVIRIVVQVNPKIIIGGLFKHHNHAFIDAEQIERVRSLDFKTSQVLTARHGKHLHVFLREAFRKSGFDEVNVVPRDVGVIFNNPVHGALKKK